MKVICIDGIKMGDNGYEAYSKEKITCKKVEQVYEGEIYTVVSTKRYYGKTYFFFAERPPQSGYNAKRFAPLSEIDETTFERNYQTEKA